MRIGKIYKIVVGQSNQCYVGSTFNSLIKYRFRHHKEDYRRFKNGTASKVSVYDLFDKYGIENCKMILIKEYLVVDRLHLKMYEQLWINKLNTINQVNCFTMLKKHHRKIQNKKYRDNNKEKEKQRLKEYRDNNKEKIMEYREKNKARDRLRSGEKIKCEKCNCEMRRDSKSKHLKSKKHLINLSI